MNFKLGWYQTLKIGTQNVKGPWRDSTSLLQKHWVPILKVKVPILNFWGPNWSWGWCWVLIWISLISRFPISNCIESKRIPGFGTGSLQGPIWLFGSLIETLFIFQGPYFHCFGFIQVKNVNSVGMYCIQQWVNLICLCWVKSCTIIVCPYLALVLCYTVGKFWFYLCLCIKFHKSLFWVPIWLS